ncbi:MAG: SGNH/GDSL hydrolase family protein [Planctomycetaceae bacterium]|nr:SGNH/GDSL hydrolase family protein [Planctomycetaceae bacterium]
MTTNAILYHLVSGNAFFSGAALVFVAMATASSRRHGLQWISRISLIVGVILITFSVTPLPVTLYAVLFAATSAWWFLRGRTNIAPAYRGLTLLAAVFAWSVAVVWEATYHVRPQVELIKDPVVGVIGDSLSAGISEQGPSTWPQYLADARQITIWNQARAGATVATARDQAATLPAEVNLLILEIGGNDLLGSTTAAEFEQGLEALLGDVHRPGRTVVMFELPLLPFTHAYGRAQRRLCAKYQVLLVPKSMLLGVLLRDMTTIDSIHLSAAGHQLLAYEVWSGIGSAFYQRQG